MKRTLAAEPPSPVERSRRKPRTHRRPRRTHSHRISSSLFESYLCSPVSRRLLCRRRHSPSSSPPVKHTLSLCRCSWLAQYQTSS
ncbi:hypothetical protein S245_012172 [Arachis hypogaea]